MADLVCPGCKRPVDFKRAKIEPGDDDHQEIVTCPDCGRRFYIVRAQFDPTFVFVAVVVVLLLLGLLAPEPIKTPALALGALIIVLTALRAVANLIS